MRENERYYQFLIARHLIPTYPFRVGLEEGTSDMVLYRHDAPGMVPSLQLAKSRGGCPGRSGRLFTWVSLGPVPLASIAVCPLSTAVWMFHRHLV
jgi:hypothetical protein